MVHNSTNARSQLWCGIVAVECEVGVDMRSCCRETIIANRFIASSLERFEGRRLK
jgi:hypothetical protein